jgi:hypothetical protein
MILKAKQSRFPFAVLAAMAAIGGFSCVWIFFRVADFSIFGFARLTGLLAMIFLLIYFLAIDFKKAQSVELTNDGVWSLVWLKPTRSQILPRFERVLLRWSDIQKLKMRSNLIYLFGAQHRVIINTVLFEDGNEVVRFINKATNADG